MSNLYGEQIREDIGERFSCKSGIWIVTEYDERVKDYQKIIYGNYIVKKEKL